MEMGFPPRYWPFRESCAASEAVKSVKEIVA